jgi:hypothetical protein
VDRVECFPLPLSLLSVKLLNNALISLVAEAVPGEPVSAGKFPANRENNREFSKKRAISAEMACLNDRKFNEFSLEFPA